MTRVIDVDAFFIIEIVNQIAFGKTELVDQRLTKVCCRYARGRRGCLFQSLQGQPGVSWK